jgi:glycosyltransferase involved in cell wall biosynthesis
MVYLRGLKENGVEIIECRDDTPGLAKFARLYRKHKNIRGQYDVMFVGYTAHILVPFANLITSKKIVFNALGSLYEGVIISRAKNSPYSLKGIRTWLNLLESDEQINFVSKKFLVPRRKLLKALTGVDDSEFYSSPDVNKLPTFTVLFRGAFLPESGIEYAVDAAKILKAQGINLRIIGNGLSAPLIEKKIKEFNLSNIEWIKDRLPFSDLRQKIQECHVSLGQLSDHDRLSRTIPHKAFETMAMKLPYLTARNKGVMELLTENETCLCFEPANAQDLAKKILGIKNNPALADKIAENAHQLYKNKSTPQILAANLLKKI